MFPIRGVIWRNNDEKFLIVTIVLMFFSCLTAFAQEVNKNLQPGDLVEAGVDWDDAVIVEGYKDTEFGYGTYRVHFKGKNGAPGYDMRINAKFVRPRRGNGNAANNLKPRIDNGNTVQPTLNKEKAGTGVMFTNLGVKWESGAKIVSYDEQKRQYRIRTKNYRTDIVPCYSVVEEGKPFDNDFYIGKWNVYIHGAMTTENRGGDLYTRYGGGMKLPPLEVKPNHTYVWVTDKGTIRGKWKEREDAPGIVLLNGIDGGDWIVYEKTDPFDANVKRDEIGFVNVKTKAGYYAANRIGANKSCVLKGRAF